VTRGLGVLKKKIITLHLKAECGLVDVAVWICGCGSGDLWMWQCGLVDVAVWTCGCGGVDLWMWQCRLDISGRKFGQMQNIMKNGNEV
jgi:hypothetical protein